MRFGLLQAMAPTGKSADLEAVRELLRAGDFGGGFTHKKRKAADALSFTSSSPSPPPTSPPPGLPLPLAHGLPTPQPSDSEGEDVEAAYEGPLPKRALHVSITHLTR